MIKYKDPLDQISEKKQQLIDAKNASEFEVGESVGVKEGLVSSWTNNPDRIVSAEVVKVNQKTLVVRNSEYGRKSTDYKINKTDVANRNIRYIGANPFDEKFDTVRLIAFQLESIIHSLDLTKDRRRNGFNDEPVKMSGIEVKELNWNPYVFDKDGNKQYYQRDFCWSLKDKQLLIESIYNGIDCGKILVRLHSWKKLEEFAKNGETELAFKDIIDGKQRMKTIQEFIFNEFPDMHGNYYADLSYASQDKLTNHQLFSYAEMPKSTTDKEVIYQFLKMNFTGVPQSQEHLEYVKEIGTKF